MSRLDVKAPVCYSVHQHCWIGGNSLGELIIPPCNWSCWLLAGRYLMKHIYFKQSKQVSRPNYLGRDRAQCTNLPLNVPEKKKGKKMRENRILTSKIQKLADSKADARAQSEEVCTWEENKKVNKWSHSVTLLVPARTECRLADAVPRCNSRDDIIPWRPVMRKTVDASGIGRRDAVSLICWWFPWQHKRFKNYYNCFRLPEINLRLHKWTHCILKCCMTNI